MRSTSLQFRRPVSRRWNADRRSRPTKCSSGRARARTRRRPPASSGRPPPAPRTPAIADAAVAQSFVQPGRGAGRARLRPTRPPRASRPGFRGRSLLGLAAAGGLPRRWPPLQPRSRAARSGRSGLSRPGAGVTRASAPAPASHPAAVGATRRSAVRTASLRRIALARRSARIREAPRGTRSVLAVPAALRVRPCAGPCTAAAGAHPLRRGGSEWQFLPPPTAQEAL